MSEQSHVCPPQARPKFAIRLRFEHLLVVVPFLAVIVRAFRAPLPLLDFWWHLKMGEIIISNHSIPRVDLFSFVTQGRPFVVQNWLAEVLYYIAYQQGGLPLLIFLNTVLLVSALVLVYLLCHEATSSRKLAALATFLACLGFFGNVRPQVFSLVFFAFFYWVLDGYRTRRRNVLWVLLPLTILWVNVHGAFLVGIGLIAIFFVSESGRSLMNPGREDVLSRRQLGALGVILFACAAATLLNPEMYGIYDYIRLVLSDRASQRLVMEWQPPRINNPTGILMFYAPFFIAALGLICSRKRPGVTDLVLFLCFSIFGLTALRNTIWFGIIAAPIITRHWGGLAWESSTGGPRKFRIIDALARWFMRSSTPRPHYRLNLVIALIAGASIVVASPWVRPGLYHNSLLDPETPVAAFDYIEKEALQGRIFHPQIFGDYLIWRLYPRQLSYFDGRVHLFGEDFVREYQMIFYDSQWEQKLAPYDIQYLLLSKGDDQPDSRNMIRNAHASPNWTVLYQDSVSVLFERRVADAPHR